MNLYKNTDQYDVLTFSDREEWKSWRIKGIGGSDASAMIGLNPWKDSNTLWKEKKGIIVPEDVSDKPYVQYGIKAEAPLRELFALDFPGYDVQYQDNTILKSKLYPWVLYSPDGLIFEKETGRRGIFENKTTNILQSMQREKWDGRIPDNYFVQCLHGLLCTGFDFVVLKAQLRYDYKDGTVRLDTRHYEIDRGDFLGDLEWLLRNEREQWEKYYVPGVEPPTHLPEI